MNELKTTGQIACDLGVPRHVVEYAIERYQISETQRVGIYRVYNSEAMEAVKRAVNRTSRRERNDVWIR